MNDDQILGDLRNDKRVSVDFKERRFLKWNEIYALYRDRVFTNRLTQRQPVNIPVIRETLQTWISKIDEPPLLTFESRTRDNRSIDGEIVLNELWNYYFEKNKLDILDNLDKKIVGLQGRSFKKWGFSKGEMFCDIIDPYDIEITPQVNPLDLNSATTIIHTHIFKPLRDVLANPKYSEKGKMDLKHYLDSKQGLMKSAETQNEWQMRQERLRTLGAYNFDDYKATDSLVEINEAYKMLWDNKEGKFVRHLIVTAMDRCILYNKPLKEAIGIEMLPIVSWADDPDLNDIWCDGKADNVLTINKVVNTYISQDLENRTYRNFGMYFYNTQGGEFQPQAFDPKPFGMYGVAGNPADVIQQMRIEPLGDTAEQIEYLKNLAQSSVAQTPTERGIAEQQQQTLGEVKLNLAQSQGRNEVTAKNYRRAWKESGLIFYELLNANSSGQITLWKKGNDGEYREKTVMPSDWKNPKGYECKVVYKAEKEAEDQFALQKATYVRESFQDNPVALRIAKRKELELLGWKEEEIEEAMGFYEQQEEAMMQQSVVDETGAVVQDGAQLSPLQPETMNQPL